MQPGAQLAQVVGERHPPVVADGVLRVGAEQLDDSGDGHVSSASAVPARSALGVAGGCSTRSALLSIALGGLGAPLGVELALRLGLLGS